MWGEGGGNNVIIDWVGKILVHVKCVLNYCVTVVEI